MGIVRSEERQRAEIEELRRMLLACAAVHRRKDDDGLGAPPRAAARDDGDGDGERTVCVTSGVSFLGRAVVSRLLLRGYSVRILVDNEEDMEKLREMETSGEMGSAARSNFSAAVAKLGDMQSLCEAFEGCAGVFHTAAFADPAGLSGYTKAMAQIEVKASESVMEACTRTLSVRKCVLTSSLLACVWRDPGRDHLPRVIGHDCWSDESLCTSRKLWYALGKLKAEKVAWEIAEDTGFKLATICPALITGPQFISRNPTATIAYLKGAKEMYSDGVLATVDVARLADAHVCVFEAMTKTASGRYICFDRVIGSEDDAARLAGEMGMPVDKICGESGESSVQQPHPRFELSNQKLSSLMSRSLRPCYDESGAI
ncbi:cinnamoyl-CoA reductase-like SNL6 [Rhodamnia argentea]|uniref:Cinnamoyl-CoA reductase-like SNL6 n=1 Tax=Rhodamnia argentea TaxID=178133 RepID=A0ABM3GWV9_9MYRT|nr:cinnamoyl-CoA reductase-like SNL6 [Rhodamnia argentea]